MFGFRKNETPIINNTNNIKCEIDYEKLANAIVEAKKKVLLEDKKTDLEELISSAIIKSKGEESNDKSNTRVFVALMSVSVALVFIFLAVLCMMFFSFLLIKFKDALELEGLQNFASIENFVFWFEYLLFAIAVLFFGLSFIVAAIEIFKERDRDFIVSAFSSVIGLAAFIVAVIALFQSNGSKEVIPYLQDIVALLSK